MQVGHGVVDEIQALEAEFSNEIDVPVPTTSFEVLRRCFVHKTKKDKYENVAGSLVLREIFGISLHGHFLAAKRADEEVGSSFLLLESPFLHSGGEKHASIEAGSGNKFQILALQPSNFVPQSMGSVVPSSSRRFCISNDLHSGRSSKVPIPIGIFGKNVVFTTAMMTCTRNIFVHNSKGTFETPIPIGTIWMNVTFSMTL